MVKPDADLLKFNGNEYITCSLWCRGCPCPLLVEETNDVHFMIFSLLHSERPKLYGVLTVLSAVGLKKVCLDFFKSLI